MSQKDQWVHGARHQDYDRAGVPIVCVLGIPGVSAQRNHFRLCNIALKVAFKGKIHVKDKIAKLGLDLL